MKREIITSIVKQSNLPQWLVERELILLVEGNSFLGSANYGSFFQESGRDGRLAKSTNYFNVTMTLVITCALKGCNLL